MYENLNTQKKIILKSVSPLYAPILCYSWYLRDKLRQASISSNDS